MNKQIKIWTDANGNIKAGAPKGVSAEDIAKAKSDYYAKAKKVAAERRAAMESFDAQYLNKKA